MLRKKLYFIPILGFSLLAIALIVERIVFWWRVKNKQRRIVREVLSSYRGDRSKAIARLNKNGQLPIARIFLEAMELEQPTPDEFRLALDSALQAEIPILTLLGLLGTILGLIQSFSAMDLGNAAGTNATGVILNPVCIRHL